MPSANEIEKNKLLFLKNKGVLDSDELEKVIIRIDGYAKNIIMPAYDMDTVQYVPNFIPSYYHKVRIINDKRVYFSNDIAYDEKIYSSDNGDMAYVYTFALLYNNKVIALGDEPGRYAGGVTDILNKETGKLLIEKLKLSNSSDDRKLYEKIKDKEIGDTSELPQAPKLIYRLSDNNERVYYLNDNTDGTFTLWLVSPDEYEGLEIITDKDQGKVRHKLFVELINNIIGNTLRNEN